MKRLALNILLLRIFVSIAQGQTTDAQIQALAKKSIFTFEGTVRALNKSNVTNIADPNKALIVRIDNVKAQTATASRGFGSWIGKEITVVPESDSVTATELKIGDHATFYTKPLLYADEIAVSAIGVVKATTISGGRFAATMAIAAEEKANDLLRKEIAAADAVVTGKVTNVRPLVKSKTNALSMVGKGHTDSHVSEHDPKWQEAVISVQAVEKGEPGQKEVVVVFPGSDDVMWARAPKFQKGEAGTWILHKNQIKDKQIANVLLAPEPEEVNKPTSYTTLSNEDFHPADPDGRNQARIQRTIEAMRPK